MYANYHTHTKRCNHATGEAEEYVMSAIENGIKKLGFSDHSVYLFEDDSYYSNFRMQIHEMPEYVAELQTLKEKYRDKIDIFCGVESEYYPKLFNKTLEYMRKCGIEYLILGQHYTNNETDGVHTYGQCADEKVLAIYCDQCIQAVETGLFSYIAHPDLIRFHGDDEIYTHHISRLCKKAKEHNIPLEINLLGVRTNREYPRPRFWEIAAAYDCVAVLGNDAHSPDVFYNTTAEQKARDFAKDVGIKIIEDIELRKI